MHDLNYALAQLCRRNRDGSFTTQANRKAILNQIGNQLHDMGYRHLHAGNLKPKHIHALVERWKSDGLSAGTMKNRMTEIRWVLEKTSRQNVAAPSNDAYGIPTRIYVTTTNRARTLSAGDLAKVTDPSVRLSLRLQTEFGLRRAESLKIRPAWADRGDRLVLKDSWTKGSRPREIPIRTEAQRLLLNEAKAFTGRGSLIPRGQTYAQHLQHFRYQCDAAGIHNVHGHRHLYAQIRYRDLTGWAAPAAGGPNSKSLTAIQKAVDREARLIISRELGHAREQIVTVYLSR
jgi:hypothetical protein